MEIIQVSLEGFYNSPAQPQKETAAMDWSEAQTEGVCPECRGFGYDQRPPFKVCYTCNATGAWKAFERNQGIEWAYQHCKDKYPEWSKRDFMDGVANIRDYWLRK